MADFNFRNEYGNLASVVGLVLTILGFLYTWWRQKQLRDVTEAAQRQALSIVQTFAERLARDDISGAANLAQELRHAVQEKRWEPARDRAERLRHQLGQLTQSKKLVDGDREFLSGATDDAQLIFQAVEKMLVQQGNAFPAQPLRTLDKLIMRLDSIDGRLKNAQLEVTNGQ